MKNLLISISFSLFPVYSFISWILTFNNRLILNHSERLIEYKKLMFNFKWDFKILNLLNLMLIAFSLIFIIRYFSINHHLFKKITQLIFISVLVIIFIFNLWGLL